MSEEGSRAEEVLDIEFLHEIGSRMAAADPFHAVLERVVEFVSTIAMCDSCFIYVLEGEKLVLRASKNPHADLVDELDLPIGQGIIGWVACTKSQWRLAPRRRATRGSRCSMICRKTILRR